MKTFKQNTLFVTILSCVVVIPVITALFPKGNIADLASIFLYDILAIFVINKVKNVFFPIWEKIEDINKNTILLAIYCVIILFSGIILSYTRNFVDILPNENELIIRQKVYSTGLIMTASSITLIPIFEELLFKVLITSKIKISATKDILVYIGLSILFAVLHLIPNLSQLGSGLLFDFAYYFIFSITTFVAYKKTNNILFPIVIHIICNIVALII